MNAPGAAVATSGVEFSHPEEGSQRHSPQPPPGDGSSLPEEAGRAEGKMSKSEIRKVSEIKQVPGTFIDTRKGGRPACRGRDNPAGPAYIRPARPLWRHPDANHAARFDRGPAPPVRRR